MTASRGISAALISRTSETSQISDCNETALPSQQCEGLVVQTERRAGRRSNRHLPSRRLSPLYADHPTIEIGGGTVDTILAALKSDADAHSFSQGDMVAHLCVCSDDKRALPTLTC